VRPVEVDLLVCPEPACRHVGKIPIKGAATQMKGYCRGSMNDNHPKRRMELVRFVEAS